MYFVQRVVIVFIAFHMYEASQDIYSEGVDMTWVQNQAEEYQKLNYYQPPIHEIFVGNDNHSLALLTCDNMLEKHPKNCELIIRTHHFDNEVDTKICKMHPPSEDAANEVKVDRVIFLRGDRVLVSWKEHHKDHGWRTAFTVVSTGYCEESDFIYIPGIRESHVSNRYWIVRFKKVFDIIFKDAKSCLDRSQYCKITYNYDGKPEYSIPSPFSTSYVSENDTIWIRAAYPMNYGSEEGVVIIEKNDEDVYSPIIGWITADNLSYDDYVYSNSSGFATICWLPYKKENELHCKWLDGTHGNDTLILTGEHRFGQMPKIYNTPNGNIVLIAHVTHRSGEQRILIDEAGIDGQCKRFAQIRESEINNFDYMRFSMHEYNKFCFSSVSWKCRNGWKYDSHCLDELVLHYRFLTRCVRINPNNYKHVKCAYGYIGLVREPLD